MNRPQSYPRIDDDNDRYAGFLDEKALVPHKLRVDSEKFRQIIENAILYASSKSSRAILDIDENLSASEVENVLLKAGDELFKYFVKYCGDPASTAFDCLGKPYSDVAREMFHNRTLQKERMNSGWRYQYIARDMSIESKRFSSVSDIGTAEADFNAVIKLADPQKSPLSIYISIKNRVNTMGGQDWPKAIRALEGVASNDKNRNGPYICIFGIAMDHGTRLIKKEQKTGEPYSINTEVWLSDFFWPFFTNYSYLEVIQAVVSTLENLGKGGRVKVEYGTIPETLIESFGAICKEFKLLDDNGNFNDAHRLAKLFVMGIRNFTKNNEV
jgi:hypothetical protein